MENHKCSVKGCTNEATYSYSNGKGKPRRYLCEKDKLIRKEQQSLSHKKKYQENKEELKKKVKAYKEANKEKVLATARKSYHKNKHKYVGTKKAYRENNKEFIKQINKNWVEANRERVRAKKAEYRNNHKAEFKFWSALLIETKWYQNFVIMNALDKNFNYHTFSDPISRRWVINDFKKVGLFISNEEALIQPGKLKQPVCIDSYIEELNLFIETKSTSATFTRKETDEQVLKYKSFVEFEIANGYRKDQKAEFFSWSPSGDNADINLKQFYLTIKDKVVSEYQKLKQRYPKDYQKRFKKKFPTLKYMALVKLCDKRAKQLTAVEQYSPSSPNYNRETVKQGLIEKLLSGELVLQRIDMNILREKYGQA